MKSKKVLFFISCSVWLYSCTDLKELPPTAGPMLVITPSQNYGNFPLTVSFSIEAIPSRGSIKNLIIDYGDGTRESIKDKLKDNKVTLTKTYERLGVFYVKLYGMDDSGAAETQETIITNDAPKIEKFSAYKDPDFVEPTSNFVPGDTVYVKAVCSDMNGISYVLFIWGDGEYTQAENCEASHRYLLGGDYNITIIVYDSNRFAPYPLSASQTIEVSVFEGAGSSENVSPLIFFDYDYVRGGVILGNSVFGVVPLDIGIFLGVADVDSDVQRIFVDWGDGEAEPVLLERALEQSGRRYIFRLSHQYKKEGEFFITAIAYDKSGKIGTKKFGPISAFAQSPAMYVEMTDANGNPVNEKTFPSPTTLKIRVVSFDVVGNYDIYIYSDHIQGISNFKEKFVEKLSQDEHISVKEFSYTLTSPGRYVIQIYAIPSGFISDLSSCIYCADGSQYLNFGLYSNCSVNSSMSLCDLGAGKLKNAQIKNERVFSFSIQ
ncbi:MAG: hypothetical protein NZ927_06050 [Candidatus Calescibacterium sp.]|nr:hypothetical protein [Candidatus Calescibacterium sp.]MDW8087776.1 hypothetical protein [Candidatus Calescibacterium sp.]